MPPNRANKNPTIPCYDQVMRFIRLFAAFFLALAATPAMADGSVVVLSIDGGIGVATSDYITSGIEHAAQTDAELIIIEMDTPGGLMNAMNDIVKAILASDVPVATYVTPEGARAPTF